MKLVHIPSALHTASTPRKTGFTLIELLVVIAIIAILAATLFPVFAQPVGESKVIMIYTYQESNKQPGLHHVIPGNG